MAASPVLVDHRVAVHLDIGGWSTSSSVQTLTFRPSSTIRALTARPWWRSAARRRRSSCSRRRSSPGHRPAAAGTRRSGGCGRTRGALLVHCRSLDVRRQRNRRRSGTADRVTTGRDEGGRDAPSRSRRVMRWGRVRFRTWRWSRRMTPLFGGGFRMSWWADGGRSRTWTGSTGRGIGCAVAQARQFPGASMNFTTELWSMKVSSTEFGRAHGEITRNGSRGRRRTCPAGLAGGVHRHLGQPTAVAALRGERVQRGLRLGDDRPEHVVVPAVGVVVRDDDRGGPPGGQRLQLVDGVRPARSARPAGPSSPRGRRVLRA